LAEALRQARAVVEARPGGPDGGDVDGSAELDASVLQSLREIGGDEFLSDVIDVFRVDAPILLATLRRSVDAADSDELRRAAHTLKANGATLGAGGFAELCRELEERARNGELDGASELAERIEGRYLRVEQALAALGAGAQS